MQSAMFHITLSNVSGPQSSGNEPPYPDLGLCVYDLSKQQGFWLTQRAVNASQFEVNVRVWRWSAMVCSFLRCGIKGND